MRQLMLLTAVLATAFLYNVESEVKVRSSIEPYVFEDAINQTLYGILQNISDPLDIVKLVFGFPNEEGSLVTGNGTVTNLDIEGIHDVEVTALNFAIIGVRLNFTVVVPKLHVFTDFDLNLAIAGLLDIFGIGNATVHLEDVVLTGSGQANLTGGVQVENLEVQVSLGTAHFEIHQLENDEELSQLLSDMLNDLAVKLVDDNPELVTALISPIAQNLINSFLADANITSILG